MSAVPGRARPGGVRVDRRAARGEQALPRRRQVPLHVGHRAGGGQRRDHPRRRHHVHGALRLVQRGEAAERMLGVPVPALGSGPAHQRGVAEPADLIDALGQLADQVLGGHPGQHGPLVRLGQPQQAERGDRPVSQARAGPPQPPRATGPVLTGTALTGDGEHELAVVVLLGQSQLGDAQQPVEQGRIAGVAVGQEAEPGGLQRHLSASVLGHPGTGGRPAPRAVNTCNPSLHEWIRPPYMDAPCEICRSGSRRAQRARLLVRTSSPWAPMTACRCCYAFVIYYLPAVLACVPAFREVSVSR